MHSSVILVNNESQYIIILKPDSLNIIISALENNSETNLILIQILFNNFSFDYPSNIKLYYLHSRSNNAKCAYRNMRRFYIYHNYRKMYNEHICTKANNNKYFKNLLNKLLRFFSKIVWLLCMCGQS